MKPQAGLLPQTHLTLLFLDYVATFLSATTLIRAADMLLATTLALQLNDLRTFPRHGCEQRSL